MVAIPTGYTTNDVEGLAVQTISVPELCTLLDASGATVLDVRGAGEYGAAHIAGSARVGLDELRGEAHEAALAVPANAVVARRSSARAEQACQTLAGGIGAGLTFSALSDTCAMGSGSLLARLQYDRSSTSHR